ncbi:FtsX-like permease family protein [Eubacterium sp.]|uniref:ABC transporter permease n=1 Tax=Eubacterium sp. TaxID=142586 RepID=UPI0025F332F3|nr:FtsX-like permease family protein [Eubacterium sp.]MCR5628687.1 ABC transporter permease [Eubacterium sp.]
MKVFIRYIRKNMLEKKGRLFLLIFSIMLSCALMVMSLGLIDTIVESFTEPMKKAAAGRDIAISSNTEEIFFKEEDINKTGIKNLDGEIDMPAVVDDEDEMIYTNLRGMKSYKKDMIEGSFKSSDNTDCIISKRIADERKLKVGDKLNVLISGEKKELKITGLATADGIFYSDETKQFTVVVNYEFLNKLLNANGAYNCVVADYTKENLTPDELDKELKKFNKNNEKVIGTNLEYNYDSESDNMIQTILYIMLGIVCVVCVLIIRGVFRLIITERMQTIGTFMSQGATKKKVQRMLLLEAFLYAVVGAIIGSVVGCGGLAILTRLISPYKKYGIYNEVHFNPVHIAIGCAFAVILSLYSAHAPIRKIKKLQVKEVILNRVEVHEKTGIITRFLTGIGAKLFRGNTSMFLAINNIRTSKLLRSNIKLLTISLAAILSIVSSSTSMTDVVVGAYEDMEYDYDIGNIIDSNATQSTTDSLINELKNDKNVKADSISPIYGTEGKLNGKSLGVYGVEPKAYGRYLNSYVGFYEKDLKDDYQKFIDSKDNVIVISTSYAKKLDKKLGDTVKLTVNEKENEFKIVTIADFKLYNSGMICLINQEKMKSLYGLREARGITFEIVKDGASMDKKYQQMTKKYGATVKSKEEEKQLNVENNAVMMKMFSAFAYIALGVAAIGIFNNITICFMQRRKEFAVMTSVGMNKSKRRNLILAENMMCAVWSVIVAIPIAFAFNIGIESLLKSMDTPMPVNFDLKAVLVYGLVVIGIVIVASLSALKKSKNISVIAELKYE